MTEREKQLESIVSDLLIEIKELKQRLKDETERATNLYNRLRVYERKGEK